MRGVDSILVKQYKRGSWYIEPFAGSSNSRIEQLPFEKKFGSDIRKIGDYVQKDYNKLWIPRGSLVYCALPTKIDLDKFWSWVCFVSLTSTVLVLAKSAPDDFVAIYEEGDKKLFIWKELM